MKPSDSNDKFLSKTLHEWRVNEPLPPRFQEQVWKRIEKEERVPHRSFVLEAMGYLERLFAIPKLAVSYATVLLVLGLTTGYLAANAKEEHLSNELAARYVQSVDPYQKTK